MVGILHINLGEAANDGQYTQKLANFCAEQISLATANVKGRNCVMLPGCDAET